MKKAIIKVLLAYLFLNVANVCKVNAQQNHFIYIQADDNQPFTVSFNGKSVGSSSIGYVIIPKLQDGSYNLNIQFPNNKYPDQQFTCVIDKNDAGFALKNFKEKGWGLFNLQTLEVSMAGAAAPETKPDIAKQNTSAFGDMLSDVTKDSSIKNIPAPVITEQPKSTIIKTDEIKSETAVRDTMKAQTTVAADESKPVAIVDPAPVNVKKVNQSMPAGKGVTKILEQPSESGSDFIFVDANASSTDTIRIFVPKPVSLQKSETANTAEPKKIADPAPVNEADKLISKIEDSTKAGSTNSTNNPFFAGGNTTDSVKSKTEITTATTDKNIEPDKSSTPASTKTDCKNMFSDADLDKLKKKLFSTTGDDKMIATALKYFQNKCVTADQLKVLSGSFLSDESRYNFFSASLPFASDVSSFASLQNQLIDSNFKKRFIALLK